MNKLTFLIFHLCLVIIISCEFVPDEVTETNVDNTGIAPPIEFSLNDYKDTIKIGWLTDFSYSLGYNGTKILSVKIDFDGKTLVNYKKDQNYKSLNFSIDPAPYDNGNYALHIEIITGSGTGSIADKLDAEAYINQLDWPVKVDKTLPLYNSTALKAIHTRKAIELSWTAFVHPNFRSYSIYRATNAIYDPVKIADFTDPLITTFIDTTFWEGERNSYFVRITSPAGYQDGNKVSVNDTLTGLKAEWRSDGSVLLRWDKVENLESFGGYYIYSYFNESSIIEKHFITDPDQNFVILNNSGFAYGLYIRLKFIPKGLNENSYSFVIGTGIRFYPRLVLPKYLRAYTVNGRDFIILANTGKLYRYQPYDMSVSDSISTRLPRNAMLAVSNDGRLFSYTDFSNIHVRRTDDFMPESQFPSPPLIKPKQWDPNYENLSFYSISNDGRLIVGDYDGITCLYDGLSGTLINKDTILIDGKAVSNGILSPDGSRLIAYSEKWPASTIASFELDAEGWKEVSRIQSFLNPVFFWSVDGSSLYLAGSEKVERRRSDLSLISGFTKMNSILEGIDIENERVLYENYNDQTIYDLNTGQVIRTLHYGKEGVNLPYNEFLINSNGLQITLP